MTKKKEKHKKASIYFHSIYCATFTSYPHAYTQTNTYLLLLPLHLSICPPVYSSGLCQLTVKPSATVPSKAPYYSSRQIVMYVISPDFLSCLPHYPSVISLLGDSDFEESNIFGEQGVLQVCSPCCGYYSFLTKTRGREEEGKLR